MDTINKQNLKVVLENFYSRIKETTLENELVTKKIALQHLDELKIEHVNDVEIYNFLQNISKPIKKRIVPYIPENNEYSTFECVTFSFRFELFSDIKKELGTYLINATRAFRASILLTFIEEEDTFYCGFIIHHQKGGKEIKIPFYLYCNNDSTRLVNPNWTFVSLNQVKTDIDYDSLLNIINEHYNNVF
jgi:hypothetical protein